MGSFSVSYGDINFIPPLLLLLLLVRTMTETTTDPIRAAIEERSANRSELAEGAREAGRRAGSLPD